MAATATSRQRTTISSVAMDMRQRAKVGNRVRKRGSVSVPSQIRDQWCDTIATYRKRVASSNSTLNRHRATKSASRCDGYRQSRFVRVFASNQQKGFGKKKMITDTSMDDGENSKKTVSGATSEAKYELDNTESEEELDERVSGRILKRIIIFSGIPLVLGFVSFPSLLLYMRLANDGKALELPLWLGYGASIFTFGAGFIGVSYGFLSASWDPEREGDFVGFEEAKKNVPALLSKYGIKLGDESQS